jgi:hypothetical protein
MCPVVARAAAARPADEMEATKSSNGLRDGYMKCFHAVRAQSAVKIERFYFR